jgi:hypothetical protein
MSMMFALYTALLLAQDSASAPQQTAFFCLLGEYDTQQKRIVSERPISLNFLLAGHPIDVDLKAPVKTYDPDNLLNSESFNLFAKDFPPGSPGYVAMTQGMSNNGYLLTMDPSTQGGAGRFDAVLGKKGSSERRYVGECSGPVGPIDEAGFDEESKK